MTRYATISRDNSLVCITREEPSLFGSQHIADKITGVTVTNNVATLHLSIRPDVPVQCVDEASAIGVARHCGFCPFEEQRQKDRLLRGYKDTLYAEAHRVTDEDGRMPFYRVILFLEEGETGFRSVQEVVEVDQLADVAAFDFFDGVSYVGGGVSNPLIETGALSLAEALEASL